MKLCKFILDTIMPLGEVVKQLRSRGYVIHDDIDVEIAWDGGEIGRNPLGGKMRFTMSSPNSLIEQHAA